MCNDVLIVPLCVTESIEKCFALLDGDYANLGKPKIQVEMAHCLSIVDKYLWGHPDLLEKLLILMATTEKWIGFALLNPWVRLVKEAITSKKQTEFGNMKKKKFDLDTCVSGMICNKSYSLADSATDEVVIPLYLLNLASHFRDLRLHGKHTVFNFEAMVKKGIPMWYFFFLGYTGPFCNLHDLPEAKDNKYPLIESPEARIGISHSTKQLGPEVWCLFMYDTILAVNKRALISTDESTILYGAHTHTQAYLQVETMTEEMALSEEAIVIYWCFLLRAQMRVVLERLRFVYLQTSKHPQTNISLPTFWGTGGERSILEAMSEKAIYKNAVRPVLDASRKEKHKPESTYRLEKHFRENINDISKYAPLEPYGFILESPVFSTEFMTHNYLGAIGDSMRVAGAEYMNGLIAEESMQSRRWLTIVYDHKDPPPGNPNTVKNPAKQNTTPPTPPAPTPPGPSPTQAPPATSPTPPPPPATDLKKRKARRYNPLGPPPQELGKRESKITDWYLPDAQSPGFNRTNKHREVKRRRTTRLDEPWGYLPVHLAQRLQKDVITEGGHKYIERAKCHLGKESSFKSSLIGLADPSLHPIPKGIRLIQTDLEQAKMMVEELLDLPETNKKVASIRGKVQEPRERVMYDQWITSAVTHASLEASILMYDSVTDIAWVPDLPIPKKLNTLLPVYGQYIIRVKVENGGLVDVEATSDWMQDNYPAETLASIQRAAYQKLEKVETSETTDEKLITGFIVIEGEGPNFVNVEGEGVGVTLDNEVINKLKYVKGGSRNTGPIYEKDDSGDILLDDKGCGIPCKRKKKIIPAKWFGYSNRTKTIKKLVTSWVTTNFDKRLLAQIKNMSAAKAAFVSVPPGADKKHDDLTTKVQAVGPSVKYQQKDGERTCMVYGLASAIHYAGGKQIASEIRQMARRFEHKISAFGAFLKALSQKHKALNPRREDTKTFDLLKVESGEMIMACLKGADGMEDHCIAVYNRWIFDSNFTQALSLTKESLDLCCSSDQVNSFYNGCTQVVSFPNIYMAT